MEDVLYVLFMVYNKKELIEKLENGEELKDDEYRVLIMNGKVMAQDHLFMIKSPMCKESLIRYAIFGAAACKLGEDGADLVKGCAYMIGTYSTNLNNYESLLKYASPCLSHMSRFNTLNFIRHKEETDKYDSYIGDLHDSLLAVFNQGITPYGMEEIQDNINHLEESKQKIKCIKNKYIGFSL